MIKIWYITTPLGIAKIEGDKNGVSEISVHDEDDLEIKTEMTEQISEQIPKELKVATSQLIEYFDVKRTTFDFKLNPKGTEFQIKVWNELLKIPFGKTISYLDLAKKLGDAKAIRAAASANGKNPIWIVIPCHRVIGADGSLTGYAGGLHRKKWLIEHETPTHQQSLF